MGYQTELNRSYTVLDQRAAGDQEDFFGREEEGMEADKISTSGIVLEGVRKRFELARGQSIEAVGHVDLDIAQGEFIALIGPSGCGKSTLLRMIAGLEKPSHGDIAIAGQTPEECIKQQKLGIAMQEHGLMPWLTTRKNIALPFQLSLIHI